jgi:ATP-dependent exoDNAse (exonuclease V) beta subunit
LYVAVTRAKAKLNLIANLSVTEETLNPPKAGSLLSALWPALESTCVTHFQQYTVKTSNLEDKLSDVQQNKPEGQRLRRLVRSWQNPLMANNAITEADDATKQRPRLNRFDWENPHARHIGTAIHRLLYQLSQQQSLTHSQPFTQPYLRYLLLNLGVSADYLSNALTKLETAQRNILADAKGRWILAQHQAAQSEFGLSALIDGQYASLIIDRTFIENDIRWIIDYKTAEPHSETLNRFLDQEQQRYTEQLSHYAKAMHQFDNGRYAIRMGLYFPLIKGWREWSLEESLCQLHLTPN